MTKVVIVGAGIAGLTAALSARELGAEVTVLERAPIEERGGNTRFSNSAIRAVMASREDVLALMPDLSEEDRERCVFNVSTRGQYLADLGRITQHRSDPELGSLMIDNSYDTMRWLVDHGVAFVPYWTWAVELSDGKVRVGLEAKGNGEGLSDMLFAFAEKQGVEIHYDTRATGLIEDDERIRGVRAMVGRRHLEFEGDAVVLAAGGFQANPEWRARYLGPGWDLVKVRGSRFDTGDGLRMALEVGAVPCGHWSGAHSTNWDMNAPDMNVLEYNTVFKRDDFNYGIIVNAHGERFVDEGEDVGGLIYAKMGPAILAQPGGFAWQVYDAKVAYLIHPEYRAEVSRRVTADTLEELVAKMDGVDRDGFLATVAEFNDAVTDDVDFEPKRRDGRRTKGLALDKSNWAQAIDTGPFEAYGVTSGITFTFGGVKTDRDGRVLDDHGDHITGLYTAGEMMGGLFYGNYPGGAGLMSAAVFGRFAGTAAYRDAARR